MDETDSHRDSSPARHPARRWRGTARAGLGVAVQGALAGALLLVSPAWAGPFDARDLFFYCSLGD